VPSRLLYAVCITCACTGSEATLITTVADAGGETSTASGGAGGSVSAPSQSLSWQIQLTGELDDSFDVGLYDVDLHNNSASDLAALHAAGRLVACYFSAGTLETWRDDAGAFPASAIGNPHPEYPSEAWLDVRDTTVRALMEARIELARSKGCDAVQPANLALSEADTGFAIGAAEVVDYVGFLAEAAHSRSLSLAWSDEPDLYGGAELGFDWGIAIECVDSGRCSAWTGFQGAGKPVFVVEIGDEGDVERVCPEVAALGFSAVIKDSNYTAFRVGCP
jgi:Glycoside-hydrolase family GH114